MIIAGNVYRYSTFNSSIRTSRVRIDPYDMNKEKIFPILLLCNYQSHSKKDWFLTDLTSELVAHKKSEKAIRALYPNVTRRDVVALYSIGGKMNKYKSTLKDANLTEFMVETARLGSFIWIF